jgi:predicted nucleotidyltransferase
MLSRIDIIERLKSSKSVLRSFGVAKIGLFGSVSRGDQSPESDIDILIDFYNDQETFDNFMNTCNFLETLFTDQKVDIVSEKGLSPFIGPHILKEVEYV